MGGASLLCKVFGFRYKKGSAKLIQINIFLEAI